MPSRSFPSESVLFARLALFLAVALSPYAALADQEAPDGDAAAPELAPQSTAASAPVTTVPGSQGEASPPDASPRWAVGLSVLEPILYYAGSSITTDSKAVVAPVPVDLHARLSDMFGIKGTLLYRYFKDGSRLAIHELAIAAGPRLSLTGKGLEGLHLAITGGLGFASGHDYAGRKYRRLDFVLRNELGYAWAFPSGLYMVFGAGLLSFFPISEDPAPIDWNSLGKLFQYYQPTINLTVGYAR
jgi:hypothetical protein